jgi:hypothetical protein
VGIELFGRRAVLTVGTVQIDGLRIEFKIAQSDKPEPNGSEIRVYNLSETTRGQIQDQTLPVTLEAGYGDDISQIFAGDIRKDGVSISRMGPDWVTTLKSLDGGEAYANSRIQESFAAGTKLTPVLKKLAQSAGVGLGNALKKISNGDVSGALTEFTDGVTLSGRSSKEMERMFRSSGYDYSVQDGQLQVTSIGGATDQTAILLSADTGLIGSPEPGAKGLTKIKSLLQPIIRPRRKVRLETELLSGFYVVRRVMHTGDTHGEPWFSEMECTQL